MKKREKQKWKRYVIGMLTCMLLLGSISPAWAANEGESSKDDAIETGTVTAIGDTTITTKKDGAVVIEMTAKTAINKWKWRTIGYYLTKNKLSVSSANLSGAAGSGVKSSHVLWVDEGHTRKVRGCPYYGKPDGTRDDVSKNGVTTTKITIDKACITAHRNAAGIKLDSGEETTLYLQGVLAFYYGETKRYGDFYSVDQARAKNRALGDGTDWSKFPKSSGEGWVKRYNIPISYMPDKTTVYINYYRKNAKADKENGATTTWTKVDGYNTRDHATQWKKKSSGLPSIEQGNGLGFSTTCYYEGEKTEHDYEIDDSTQGIPSSEPQYVNVYADDYVHSVTYEAQNMEENEWKRLKLQHYLGLLTSYRIV